MDPDEKVGRKIGEEIAKAIEDAYDKGFERGRKAVHRQHSVAQAVRANVSLDTFQIVAELRSIKSMPFSLKTAEKLGEALGKMMTLFDDYIAMPDFDFRFSKKITIHIIEIAATLRQMPGGKLNAQLLGHRMKEIAQQRKEELDPEIFMYAKRVANMFYQRSALDIF